jgi:hypothetical protein
VSFLVGGLSATRAGEAERGTRAASAAAEAR